MQQPPDTRSLAEALVAFRTTRSSYQSTSDQALTQLLISLAEHAIAWPTQPVAGAIRQQESPELATLQARLDALQAAYEAQQAELARLRKHLSSQQAAATLHGQVASPPREVRPIEYWEQRIPDYGDATTVAGLDAYHTKSRVLPEDIVLTAEDKAQLEPPRPRQPQQRWVTILVWIIALLLMLYTLSGLLDLRGLFASFR